MWRLIEAAIGHEADRHLSGTVEVDEIYVSCGHKAEPESAPNPVQPLSAPTGGAAGACGTVPVGATPTRIVPWSSCWFSAAGRG
jgi:hypothetical protein